MSKYRSLADVYGDNAFKSVPKLQRQRVIGEDTQIIFKTDDGKQKIVGYLPDEEAKKLQRQVANRSGGSFRYIDEILQEGGWKSSNNKKGENTSYNSKILIPVVNAIEDTSDVNNFSLKLIKDNKNKLTKFSSDLQSSASSGDIFSLYDSFSTKLVNDAFSNVKETIKAVYDVEGAVSGVGVGKGEICFTFFSDAVQSLKNKGQKGDVFVPGFGTIEVKGEKGRAGATGKPAEVIEYIQKLLSKTNNNVHTAHEVREKYQELVKSRNDLLNYIQPKNNIEKKSKNQNELNFYSNKLNDLYDLVKNLHNLVVNDKEFNYDDFEISFNNLLFGKQDEIEHEQIPALSDKFNKETTKQVNDKKNNFISSVQSFLRAKKNKLKIDRNDTTNHVVPAFFLHDWNLDKKHIVDTFLQLSSESETVLERKSYKEGLNEILTPELLEEMQRHKNKNILEAIIASLQICQYHAHEKFNYLLFCNNKLDALVFSFDGEGKKEIFVNSFNKILDYINKGILNVDMGMDIKRHHGTSITLKS